MLILDVGFCTDGSGGFAGFQCEVSSVIETVEMLQCDVYQ